MHLNQRRHRCSPVNLLHIFKSPFYKNTSWRLLLMTFLSILLLRTWTQWLHQSQNIKDPFSNWEIHFFIINSSMINFLSMSSKERMVSTKNRIYRLLCFLFYSSFKNTRVSSKITFFLKISQNNSNRKLTSFELFKGTFTLQFSDDFFIFWSIWFHANGANNYFTILCIVPTIFSWRQAIFFPSFFGNKID